uniref:Stress response protein NST1 n=1 Tax=Melanopsichium pennsylvanicum 4 TaxID=1398559 RepID=A0A077RBF5_9BASI|nr:conserved hypothetical protein [Melanopsichium pennsylvanicum 4]
MAKSKLPRSTPAARGPAVPPPKLAAAAQQQYPPQSPTPAPMQQQPKAPIAGASTPPRSASPVSNHDVDSAALASAKKKKKKSKSKAKDSDFIDDHEYDLQSAAALGQRPRSPASLAARAQAQAQLLAAASELYRRIEGDAQGIPDDDAYWTSLPAHLRTFIRNALPLGQFPPAAQAALNENVNDPANRHASTQAMIAVAQQLAQAAHASQRHLQQYPPGTHPYPPLPFDASIFADLALHPDQALPLHPHPNAANNVHQGSNGTYGQYASSPNPPPTQPPVEPLPPPVRVWMQGGHDHAHGPNGLGAHPDALRSASKNKKKKKKKKGGAIAEAGHGDDQAHEIEVEVPPPPKPVPNHPPPSTNVSSVTRNSNAPAPSSRAAGKQPMTFNSSGKTSARPANGVAPSSNSGKRSVSSSTHGQQPAANVSSNNAKIWSTSSAEERERIKGFWLGLSMKDRQKLVQVEKETVLKKMKEQQKFLCSCAVCGRKRSAIEEELEVLYDSYYDELEEYANHQQRWASSGGTIPPPPGPGPFPGSVALDASGAVIGGDPLSRTRAAHGGRDARHTHPHPHGRKAPLHPESSDGYDDDELDDDAEYDDEDDDAEYDDEEEEDDIELDKERARDDYAKRNPVPSARRRDTNDNNDLFGLGSSLTVKGGILTVADDMLKNDGRKFLEMMEQLAERRMHPYRERVAQERQLQLLRELEEEDTNEKAREARRVKESQKKKDKKKAQREAKEAEKMRKDQERAAVEAEERAKQQAQRDAELKKQEEIRQKKEAERKAREDEKAKKEEERRRRQAEERERQMEVERKRREKEDKIRLEREAQEKAKRDREEAQRKAKEEQERNKREKAEREAKAKEEQERKVEAARKEKEARAQANRESKQAAAAAASQSRGSNATPLIPPSPTAAPKAGSAKATAASTPATPARATKNGSIPGFPAVNQGQPSVRGNGSQRGAGGSRSAHSSAATNTALATNASSAVPAAASANAAGSTLPAPPQGLPPRPSTAVLTPAGSSSQSSSVSVAANAGLPRPPVNSSSGSTAASSLGFGSIGPSASASVAAPASKAPGSSISPKPTQPAFVQTQDKPSSQLGYSSPVPPVGATYGQQPGLEGLRSPTLTNGLPSSSVFGSNGGMSSNLQSPSLGGHAMGGMTSNLASLNLNATSRSAGLNMGGTLVGSNAPVPGMESSSSSAHGVPCLGSNMQSPTQTPFAPMAGSNSVDPMRSRTASFADSDPMSAFAGIRPGSSLSQRVPAYRSGAPTPIGPIGRPKAMDPIQQHVHHEDHTGAIGNGRSSSSASGSGATSPRLPEGILGSSALGGDDDIVDPKPRRVSHTIPIGGGASGSSMGGGGSFFGGMGGSGAVGSGFGVSSSSPWSSFSASNQAAPGPLSPGFNTGAAPVSIGSSLGSNSFGMNQNAGTPGLGSNPPGLASGGQSDPWARVSAGWDRARYAFEQPGANHGSSGGMGGSLHGGAQVGHSHGLGGHTNHLHHQMSPGTGSSANGAMLSPFNLGAPGSGGRNLFGAPGSTVLHPGAIGSALSPTSPSDGGRHVSGSHE